MQHKYNATENLIPNSPTYMILAQLYYTEEIGMHWIDNSSIIIGYYLACRRLYFADPSTMA